MQDKAPLYKWSLAMSMGVVIGLIVAALTALTIGHAAWHLPGGSIGGAIFGAWLYKPLQPAWLRFLLFATSGFLGWLVFIWCFR